MFMCVYFTTSPSCTVALLSYVLYLQTTRLHITPAKLQMSLLICTLLIESDLMSIELFSLFYTYLVGYIGFVELMLG